MGKLYIIVYLEPGKTRPTLKCASVDTIRYMIRTGVLTSNNFAILDGRVLKNFDEKIELEKLPKWTKT
jgi:hypothetical protein